MSDKIIAGDKVRLTFTEYGAKHVITGTVRDAGDGLLKVGAHAFEGFRDRKVKRLIRWDLSGYAVDLDCEVAEVEGKRADRALAAHDREVAAKALRDAADELTIKIPDILGYKVQAVFTESLWERADELSAS